MEKIDFVIIWVDDNDPVWIQARQKYSEGNYDNKNNVRYRDWDNLIYLFRGIEKFTPWVNKVHFVTCGHLPAWLNVKSPKLNIVKHSDYIDDSFLPTFSSRPIELNIHRIKDLSEQFVFFNDDMFILDYMQPEDFFVNGKPRDCAILNILRCEINAMPNTVANDLMIINKYFRYNESLKQNWGKWINPVYGKDVMRTILLSMWNTFPGFLETHLPNAYLKATFKQVWELEEGILNKTCSNRFRSPLDCNQWLMRYWQLASGEFIPRSPQIGKMFSVANIDDIIKCIEKQQKKLICVNDSEQVEDYESCREIINRAFHNILPDKSSFEI